MIAWRHGMVGEAPGRGDPLIPRPSLSLPALRQAVAAVAPGRLPEMFSKMQEAFVRAGEEGSVTPIHLFYREWAVVRSHAMKKPVWIVVGVVIALLGLLFRPRGTGVMSGPSMSRNTFWAVAGPVIAIAVLALASLGVRDRSS